MLQDVYYEKQKKKITSPQLLISKLKYILNIHQQLFGSLMPLEEMDKGGLVLGMTGYENFAIFY